jgi:hypothetical protein
MAEIDVEEVKAALIRVAGSSVAGQPHPAPSGRQFDREFQDELRVLMGDREFRAYTEPLERFRVAQHKAMMATLADRRARADGRGVATAVTIADAIASERLAAGLLAQPQTSTFAILDTPFLIWQIPRPDDWLFHVVWPDDRDPNPRVTPDISFKDSHIEPFNSWFRVYVEGNSGPYATSYVTYYMWENPSDSYALVNVQERVDAEWPRGCVGILGKGCGERSLAGCSGDVDTNSLVGLG